MKKVLQALSLVFFSSALLIAQSTSQPSGGAAQSTPAPNATVNPTPQSRLIHILTPVGGQASSTNAVHLRFQLTNSGAAAGEPNFQLQLDGQDPITTSATEYTYTGLAPGTHSIRVVLVDANGTPVPGASASVQFIVKNPTAAPASDSSSNTSGEIGGAMQPQSSMAANNLPILSLIGFGVLIGGVASAFKTRE